MRRCKAIAEVSSRSRFRPRVLTDVSKRSTKATLFGKDYAAPFGIAPMGAAALCAYRGDLALARAAAASQIPMVVSASSLIRLEEIRDAAPDGLVSGLLARRCGAHRAGLEKGRGGGFRDARRHDGRAAAGEPREQRPQRFSAADRADAAGGLGHRIASALVAGHLAADPAAARHAAFREHGGHARAAGFLEQSHAQRQHARSVELGACRVHAPALERAAAPERYSVGG